MYPIQWERVPECCLECVNGFRLPEYDLCDCEMGQGLVQLREMVSNVEAKHHNEAL